MNRKDFYRYFGIPEFNSIAGKKYINLIVLTIILFISLLAIGLGKSSTSYLKNKMDNPFIKFVNVVIPYTSKNESIDIKDFEKTEFKSNYGYSEVSPIYYEFMSFMSKDNKPVNAQARMITESSEFYKFISDDDNILLTDINFSDNAYSCIVTKSLLEKLGIEMNNISYINFINSKLNDTIIPLPVAAVVSQLPDYTDILISKKLYNAIKGYKCMDISNINHQSYLKFYIPNTNSLTTDLLNNNYKIVDDEMLLTDKGIVVIKFGVNDYNTENKNFITKYPEAIKLFDLSRSPCDYSGKSGFIDYISFSFNNLDSISSFQSFLVSNYGLKIDMNTIESKENFNFFNKLSILLSISLIAFSILTIFIFITNIIISHLERNKQNLGTLKAFGLDNKKIISQYTVISIVLVASSFLIAYLLSSVLGQQSLKLMLKIANINTTNDIQYINISFIYLVFIFLIIPTIIIYIKLWKNLRNKTPGDLIYNR